MLLPPANEVFEGYVFTRVCLSTGGSTWAGTPPRQVHPQAGTPLGRYTTPLGRYTPQAGTSPRAVHAGRYGQQAGGTHPTVMHSCLHNQVSRPTEKNEPSPINLIMACSHVTNENESEKGFPFKTVFFFEDRSYCKNSPIKG